MHSACCRQHALNWHINIIPYIYITSTFFGSHMPHARPVVSRIGSLDPFRKWTMKCESTPPGLGCPFIPERLATLEADKRQRNAKTIIFHNRKHPHPHPPRRDCPSGTSSITFFILRVSRLNDPVLAKLDPLATTDPSIAPWSINADIDDPY